MTFVEFLASATRAPGALVAEIPEVWYQGRTAYGGLTTALAFEAARSVANDLPPLRSAQIAFIGPVQGKVDARATLVRRGRSTAFVESKLYVDGAVALIAMFVFASGRESATTLEADRAPEVPAPETAPQRGIKLMSPMFISQFDFRYATPPQIGVPEILQWVRLREREGVDPMTELLIIADALPPAAMPLMSNIAPVSSINWHINFLTGQPTTPDGWWLLRATAQNAGNGLSSQAMDIWNADGEAIAKGMQCMALFG